MVIGEPRFSGLIGLTHQSFTVRVAFTTQPLKQWRVRFALDAKVILMPQELERRIKQ